MGRGIESTPDSISPRQRAKRRFNIAFDDAGRAVESFGIVNSAWARELTARGHRIVPLNGADASQPDFVICHNYLKDFCGPHLTAPGKHIAVRTSDFGPYPPLWAERINQSYDQLWVHTRWIRDQALASGIQPNLVRMVPDGFDPHVFKPEGPRRELPTSKRVKFLFVGGAVVRKGIDTLLNAYRLAFTRDDDVTLVIKDHGVNLFYEKQPFRDDILARASDPVGPEIIYMDDHLAVEDLASLYRACDFAVFPFRCEGFVMPALESLACGTPTLIPHIGPCVDFSDSSTSLLMRALRVRLPVRRRFELKFGISVEVDAVDFCEVKVQTLVDSLHRAFEMRSDERSSMSASGVKRAHSDFTWKHIADNIEQRLIEMAATPTPRRHLDASVHT